MRRSKIRGEKFRQALPSMRLRPARGVVSYSKVAISALGLMFTKGRRLCQRTTWPRGRSGRKEEGEQHPVSLTGPTEDGNCFPLPVPATRGSSVPATLLILAVDSTTGSVTITPFG